MERSGQTEHKHVVARFYQRVTVDKHTFAVAYKACESHLAGKLEVFHRRPRNLGARTHLEFGNLGISKGEALRCGGVCIEKQLEYGARRRQLLIHNGTYVEILGLRYELYVLDIGHCLAYAYILSCQAGEYIRFGAVGKSHESIHIGSTDIGKEVGVACVAVYNLAIRTFLRKLSAYFEIAFHNLEFELLVSEVHQSHSNLGAAHYQHSLDFMLGLAGERQQVVDMVAGGGKIQKN